MRPSNQPRLAPNGGSSLKPAWFLLAIPGVMASTVFPPLLLIGGFVAGLILLVKWSNRRDKRAAAHRHELTMAEYHRQRAVRQLNENWTNPGWRP